jgi:organic hydroperoxide reductase OsmC/OhrA
MKTQNYNVDVKWENNRKGIMCSSELSAKNGICIEVASSLGFPKGIEGIWSPEHLFVASVSGSLMTTFLAIAEESTLEFKSFSCSAKGKLEPVDGKLIMSEVYLKATVVIQEPKFANKAMRILKKAEDGCLIIRSIKARVTMEINVEVHPILIESKL